MGHLTIAKEHLFKALADRLDKNPVGAPINETLMEILYRLYTDTEAEIGAKFPMLPVPIEKLAATTGLPVDDLSTHLNNMANKGLVIDITRESTTFYMLSPLVIGFFEYTFMRVTNLVPMGELAVLFEKYHHEPGVTAAFFGADTKLLQTLPYENLISLEVQTEVLNYQKASDIIRDAGGGSLTMCYCRHQAQHMGRNCAAPIEDVCTSLGNAAEWLIRRGFARAATTDELLRVLDKTAELGLVHLGDNVQNNPAYICHCCGCCCALLKAIHEDNITSVVPSNFIPQINEENCIGCGICSKRCHIKAIDQVEQVPGDAKSLKAIINKDRCIGCGACIPGCKKQAMTLVPRGTIHVPPRNKKEQMFQIAKQNGKLALEKLVFSGLLVSAMPI